MKISKWQMMNWFKQEESPADGGVGGGGLPPEGGGDASGSDGGGSNGGGSGDGGGLPPEGDGGAKPSDMFASLPDDTKESLSKAGIKDFEGLVQNWRDAQSYIGSSIRVPSKEAGKEDWQKFYQKLQTHAPNLMPRPDRDDPEAWNAALAALGRPEEPTGYELPEVPEGISLPEERVEALRKIAHEQGLNKDQFKNMLNSVLELDAQQYKAHMDAVTAEQDAIKKEWGSAYDERSTQVIRMLELTQAPEGVVEMAKNGQLGADTLKWMYSVSKNFKGEGTNLVSDQGNSGALTPAEAQQRISEIYANKEHPYFVADHPEHKDALQKMIKLQKAANPQSSDNINDLRSSVQVRM